MRSFMIPGASLENFERIESEGIKIFRSIPHELPEARIQLAIAGGENSFISLRNKSPASTMSLAMRPGRRSLPISASAA